MPKDKKKKQDSVTFVKEKFEEAEDWGILRQVQINRSFYSSRQWISFDSIKRQVFVPELRPGELRLTFNKIKPAVLTLLAKLCKNRVQLEVKPDTNDIDRIETAKAGFKYLTFQWDDNKMDTITRRLKFHMLLDGLPALEVYVDKNKGDEINADDEIVAELTEGQPVPMRTGKICTVVRDQFSLYTDPNAECPEDIKWVIKRIPVDVDQIEDDWGVEVAPEGDITVRNTFDGGGLQTAKQRTYKHHAWLYDFWELPCGKYPKGRRIVVAGDKELENSTDPGEWPYIFFPAVPLPGSAIATGIVTDLTTPQKSYNIKRTAEARILEEMGNPMWLNPGTDDEELVNEIGGIVHYSPANEMKPERVPGIEPGNGWQAAMERDEADIEDISGAHEISQGATPKGNNTLGGLQLQVEQDETKLALLVQSFEDGIKEWGNKVLRLVQKHFPEEQQLSIVGENGDIEAFTFAGADLSGGEVVDVVPGSSMPTLKAVQDQKIMAMYEGGLFNNPQTGQPDSRRVMRMLGESIAEQYFNDAEQDENKALNENRAWQQAFSDEATVQALMTWQKQMHGYQQQAAAMAQRGVPAESFPPPQPPVKLPVVRDFYDHEVHIAAHNRYRKSDEYDKLPPPLQAIVDQHVAEHVQALQAPQMQAQQQQAAEAELQARQQAEESDKQRQHEQATKQQDHSNRMQETAMKSQAALQQAAMRGMG